MKSKTLLISSVLLVILLSFAACNSNSNNPSGGLIKAKWVTAEKTDNDTLFVQTSDVKKNTIIHFKYNIASRDSTFMAYELDGNIFVRANVCPPCGSIGFSLQKDVLVCDTCATKFNARTGNGTSGACVNYPKSSVAYETDSGKIIMKVNELIKAYQDTLRPG